MPCSPLEFSQPIQKQLRVRKEILHSGGQGEMQTLKLQAKLLCLPAHSWSVSGVKLGLHDLVKHLGK